MAYYLQSLVRVIKLILCHEKQHKYFDDNNTTPQLHSLMEKACFLRDSFANHAILSHQQDSFEDRIRDVAENAEDVLETYVSLFATEHAIPAPDLLSLLESLDSVKDEMMKILDGDRVSGHRPLPAVASSRINERNPNNIMVGFTEDLLELKCRVFGESSQLEIIPIVGMGGIGKTTLARSIHDDSSVVSHFDVRAWTTVSNNYSLRDILLGLLCSIPGNQMIGEEEAHTLGLTLHQGLMGRRYLIVLDDIWRSEAWYEVRKYFPDDDNRSRIILTTRESNVATDVDLTSLQHQVRPLGIDDSWELVKKKVFGEEACLPELEKLGRKIANSCGGLPLALQVIGGLLSQTERKKSSWEQVASDIISAIANEDEQISGILSLSYNNLPYYLKPCFLYMSAFREDSVISSSLLLRWWIAEGFLIPIVGKSPEEVASAHINALIERNLIFVREQGNFGDDTPALGIHDLLLELCVLKAREKKFFHVVDGRIDLNASRDMSGVRRVNFISDSLVEDTYDSTRQKQLTRSLLTSHFFFIHDEIVGHGFCTLRLMSSMRLSHLTDVSEDVNLRYLSLDDMGELVGWELNSRITTFRNLQFLIIKVYGRIKVPHELFEMPQLREICSAAVLVCDFKEPLLSKNLVFQDNLHTLPILEISANIEVVLAKFPNLKKLALEYSGRSYLHPTSPLIIIVSCLRKIERLSMRSFSNYLLEYCSFSNTLKSLLLSNFTLPKAFMEALGMLPNLEVLKLYDIRLEDTKHWKLSEEKFSRLKHLTLSWLNWVRWEADETHFPILEQLVIEYCNALRELPLAIGDIDTLKKLTVDYCNHAAEAWATQIKEEQLDYGNELLQVHVY